MIIMTLKQLQEMFLVNRDGSGIGKMDIWLDDEQVAFLAEDGKEMTFDEDLAIEIHEVLSRYMRPISGQAIRKTINREAGYKKTADDNVINILENMFLKAGVIAKKRVMSVDRYYVLE